MPKAYVVCLLPFALMTDAANLASSDNTNNAKGKEYRDSFDTLLNQIQNAREALKPYIGTNAQIDSDTSKYLKAVEYQLLSLKRDLTNHLHQKQTKQTTLNVKPNKQNNTTKQTQLRQYK